MNPAILFLMIACSTSQVDVDAHQRFMALHHKWQRIHEAAEKERTLPEAVLVFDPRKYAIWIEQNGKVGVTDVERLPIGLDWTAFIITPQGVSPLSFPVRINSPRSTVQNEAGTESIWLIGAGKVGHWEFDIAGTKDGHAFHIGSGTSTFSSRSINLPKLNAIAVKDGGGSSILDSKQSIDRKWTDAVRTKWFSINVIRTQSTP